VILPPDFHDPLLNDSKQMSERNRDRLRPIIEREAVAWAVAAVPPERIDEINILNASFEGMCRAVGGLRLPSRQHPYAIHGRIVRRRAGKHRPPLHRGGRRGQSGRQAGDLPLGARLRHPPQRPRRAALLGMVGRIAPPAQRPRHAAAHGQDQPLYPLRAALHRARIPMFHPQPTLMTTLLNILLLVAVALSITGVVNRTRARLAGGPRPGGMDRKAGKQYAHQL